MPSSREPRGTPRFWPGLATLLLLAVGHTLWATSLDSFTIDEPYHIAAGASYLRWGDFRINPEHPPLVKLVVALAEPPSVLHLAPLTILNDKRQERVYTQTAVFKDSDSVPIHRRARYALIAFNTFLLVVLTLLLRRVFNAPIALATLLLLALDPTVSAHMPVVMTDLPMSLLGAICCSLACLALRERSRTAWLLFGIAAGLLLATKHSAPLILLPLALICTAVILWQRLRQSTPAAPQLAGLAIAALLSLAVLWSAYGFRFHESRQFDPAGHFVETFNRPLTDKIADLRSPVLRQVLTLATNAHIVPRAYIWGLADTLRAGVEGRPLWINVFGHSYQGKAPPWVPFAFLMVKLPLAFIALALTGLALLLLRRIPREIALPLSLYAAMLFFFMAFIAKNGIFYAGLRHWLFAVPLLAIAAAVCLVTAFQARQLWLRVIPVIAILWIAIDVLPQRRIWEYHNAIAGGSAEAWRNFDNESVDLGQRTGELIAFAKANISPAEPILNYWSLREQLDAGGIHEWDPTPDQVGDGHITGWLIYRASSLPVNNWHNVELLRNIAPTARRGNAFFYHGTFFLPKIAAGTLNWNAFRLLEEKGGDRKLAESYFQRVVKLNPEAVPAWIELANFALERNQREQSLDLYQQAFVNEKHNPDVRADIARQIDLVKANPTAPPMRNPSKE
jgi:tetratricopeptide (TPR) repeat protein